MATAEPVALNITSFYAPWPKQVIFHSSNAKYRLEVGGFGSGKSRPLLMEAIFHAIEYPGSESIILRKTVPDLKRTVISKFQSDVPKELYERYNESDHIVYFHPVPKLDANGKQIYKADGQPDTLQSKLYFAACERDVDVNKYLSTEYVFIGFEELGEFSFAIWSALADRNRCPIPGSRSCMAGSTNPFGQGWAWIKKLWGCGTDLKGNPRTPQPLAGMDAEQFNPADYEYFHSTVLDNPIYAADPEYVKRLMSSPNRDVVFHGNLDAIAGLYFDNYMEQVVERSRDDFIFQDWQPVWLGWDYGFSHFACVIFFTKAILKPRLATEKPRMVNVAIRELVMQASTPEKQTEQLILEIPRKNQDVDEERRRNAKPEFRWNVESIHFSWERFNRSVSNRTVADEVGDLLDAVGLPRPIRSNTDRVAGWTKMYSLLEAQEFFIIRENCPVLCEALPQLPRDKKNIEDVHKPDGVSLYDDMGDACRYGIAGVLLDEEDKPKEQQYEEELAKITDPMARFAKQYEQYNKSKQEEANQARPARIIPSWRSKIKPR